MPISTSPMRKTAIEINAATTMHPSTLTQVFQSSVPSSRAAAVSCYIQARSTTASGDGAQVGSRAEPPSVSEGTLDAAEDRRIMLSR